MNSRITEIIALCFLFSLFSCSNKGKQIPEFNLKTLAGVTISEKNLKGKITVINVWATWCGSCLQEIPELNELANRYVSDTTIVFLAISAEPNEKIERCLQQRKFDFIQIPAAKELVSSLKTKLVKTYPQHIIIGKDLKIKFEHSGEINNLVKVLGIEIEKER
jgi:thiol-disulfide isomerase/thioredoxin